MTKQIQTVYTEEVPKKAILVEQKFYRKAKFWRNMVGLGFMLLFTLAFWKEIGPILAMLGAALGISPMPTQTESQILRELAILFINLVSVAGMFLLAMLLISQFVLPVITSQERSKVFSRLLSYISGSHGPAIFIREAKEKAREEELKSSRPGVAFVDLCSAIALEKNWVPMGAGGSRQSGRSLMRRIPLLKSITRTLKKILGVPGKLVSELFTPRTTRAQVKKEPLARVAGPGIVFTEWGERIRGVADLRRQFRVNKNVSVSTRDGFDIRAPVWVLFTLGDPPEVLKVTHVGGREASNIRAIKVNERTKVIEGFADELDAQDKAEVHQFAHALAATSASASPPSNGGGTKKTTGGGGDGGGGGPTGPGNPPYIFDSERVFSALYSEARNLADGNLADWSDLPLQVAIEQFRDMLSQEDFNLLYRPDDPDDFPFNDRLKPDFTRALRNQGVLAFQYVSSRKGRLLEKGDAWDERHLNISPVTNLRSPKVLRDRGIKVIAAGFSELTPTDESIRGQLVDYWKANWQKAVDLTDADAAFETMRAFAQARADAQREMVDSLMQIINLPAHSEAAVALRVMQALETAAADPRTRAMLPPESMQTLTNLRGFLFPNLWIKDV